MTQKLKAKSYQLNIGWLYPELMSTYGDKGNIMTLQKRCEWRGIEVKIINIDQRSKIPDLKTIDLLFAGGAQDREQSIVIQNLKKHETEIRKLIEKEVPALFVCGAPQLFGKYYEPSIGKRLDGLGIFDIETIHAGPQKKRLTGNVIAKIINKNILNTKYPILHSGIIVGFENHGGRTYLGKYAKPFAMVIKGYGNNGEDGTEGVVYKNAIGSYLHGPLLPKNPGIADWLITKAITTKYKQKVTLAPLDNAVSNQAKSVIARRLGIKL